MNTIMNVLTAFMTYFFFIGCLTLVIMMLLDMVNAVSTNIKNKVDPLLKRKFNINVSDKISKIIIFIIGIIILPIYIPAEFYMNSKSRKRFIDRLDNTKDK